MNTVSKTWRVPLLIAGLHDCGLAAYHFILPYHMEWRRGLDNVPDSLVWALFALNFSWSVLLFLAGALVIYAAFLGAAAGKFARVAVFTVGLFWAIHGIYTWLNPLPLPPSLSWLRIMLGVFPVVVILLHWLPLFVARTAYRVLTASPSSRVLLVALTVVLSSGCSLVVPSLRPIPGADRNLRCAVEYRPDPAHDGPDLLFTAAANPYKWEEGYMNPLEGLVHTIIGPGRYLSAPVQVSGATCESPWQAGHRIPMSFKTSHYLLCRREGHAEVRIAVQTKWGACEQVIPAGDDRPRCRPTGYKPNSGLRFLSHVICPVD